MDCACDVEAETPTRLQDKFPRYSKITLVVGEKQKGWTEEKAARQPLETCVSFFFGTPDIHLEGADSRFIGSEFSRIRNEQNAPLQAVIAGHPEI